MEQRLPPYSLLTTLDERYMCQALKEAWKAFDQGEVPVGAIVVFQDRIIGKGFNQVETLQDATAHAEMVAIGAASSFLMNWRLEECTLYTTIEPCLMCAGACILSRMKRIVWGAPDIRHGGGGSLTDLFALPHPIHTVEATSSVLTDWCSFPIKQFFLKRRAEEK